MPTELHPTLYLLSTFLWEGGVRIVHIAPIQWHSMYLAIFASLVAPFGGFFASGIKVRYILYFGYRYIRQRER